MASLNGREVLDNGGRGQCGFASVMQQRAIDEGYHPRIVQDAFLRGDPKLLARLFAAARKLTIKSFAHRETSSV